MKVLLVDERRGLRRAWDAPLWAHAAALGVILLVLLPLTAPGSAFTSDEGVYALQARALEAGSWAYPYRSAHLDDEGRWFPVALSDQGKGNFYPYARHPLYPLLLRAGAAIAGETVGLHVLSLLAVVGAAAAAWLLSEVIHPGSGRAAFWLAGASPLVVNGFFLWAHAASAAVAGVAALVAVRVAASGLSLRRGAALGTATAAGVFLRSEGLLFAVALALALAAFRRRKAGRSEAAIAGAVVLVPAVVAALAERAWVGAILGGRYDSLQVRGDTSTYLGGRISGAWHELLEAHYLQAGALVPALLAMGVFCGLGFLALRRWRTRSRRDLAVATAVVVLALAVRHAVYPGEAIPGLFTAWPLVLLGLLLTSWREDGPGVRLLGALSALYAAAVFLSQYPEGGGLEWGGRFLSPLVVPLAALTASALRRRLGAVPRPDRGRATALLASAAVVTAAFALASVIDERRDNDRLIAAIARHPSASGVTVTTVAALPRLAWRTHDQLAWMLAEKASLPILLQSLRDQDVQQVAAVVPVATDRASLQPFSRITEVEREELHRQGLRLLLLAP